MELIELLSVKNIVGFLLVLTRLSGMIFSAPLFSTYPIPTQVKIWLVALVAFIMYPMVSVHSGFSVPNSMPEMILYMAKEFGVGFLIGYLANFIFAGIQMGGQLLSIQLGLSMSNVLDPVSQSQSPVLGEFYILMTAMIFLGLNAYQWLFAAVYQSFVKIPPGLDFLYTPVLVEQVIRMGAQMFEIAMGVVLPIFCVLFILEVLIGVLAKMIPQMNIFMVAIPLKIFLGLFLMIIFLDPMATYVNNLITTQMVTIVKMFM
ncbi:MAG: flagellar biosynthetic protein FliR [Candidatus Gastranaerophilales bacterium]|nr:flagellar biosynthetic protein FliR [Candidatus Gastranaerophilales bacterium]